MPVRALGTTLNSPDPEIIPPDASTIPPGKQVGDWTNPSTWANRFTNGPRIDPSALAGAGSSLPGRGGFWPSLLYGLLYPSQTSPNDTISPEMARQLPQHPPSTGAMPPVAAPFQQPQHPSTMRFPMWPTPPVTPTPQGPPGYLGSTSAVPETMTTGAMTPTPPQSTRAPDSHLQVYNPPPPAPANVNLGYYRPTSGNVRGGGAALAGGPTGPGTWTQYTDPNDPRIYRGS